MKNTIQIALSLLTMIVMVNCDDARPKEINKNKIPNADEIALNIKKIIEEGNQGNYFTYFLSNDYLIQGASNKGDSLVRCEASHNLKTNTLTSDQKSNLEKLGWIPPNVGELNYWIMQPIDSDREIMNLAELFVETIRVVYKSTSVDSIIVNLEK